MADDDDTGSGRERYYESAYGNGKAEADGEEPLDPSQVPPEVREELEGASTVEGGAAVPTGAGDEGERAAATAESDDAEQRPGRRRSGLARTLDRIAETMATIGVYIAVASTATVPVALAAVGLGVQPEGNYLVTAAVAGWMVAMALALVAGVRETDPYEDSSEKKEVEQSFF